MKLAKAFLMSLFLLPIFHGITYAQPKKCDSLIKSTTNYVRVPNFTGKPGDIVKMPVYVKTDTLMTGFQFIIQFDTTWLTPVTIPGTICDSVDSVGNCLRTRTDSSYVDFVLGNGRSPHRFVKTKTVFGTLDTTTNFSAPLLTFGTVPYKNVVNCLFLPTFDKTDSIASGEDTLFFLKFTVKPTMPLGQKAFFTFFEKNLYTYFLTGGLPDSALVGCTESNMSHERGGGTYNIFPTTNGSPENPLPLMYFEATSGGTTPSVSLTANPTSFGTGGGSTILTWSSINADTVKVTVQGQTTPLSGSGPPNGNLTTSVTSTTTFVATAKQNATGATATSTVTVTVSGTSGAAPVITVPQILYSINAGETVSFQVSAADAEGGQISLGANGATIPAGGSFGPTNPVVGLNSASGTFSWVPNTGQTGTFQITFSATDPQGNVGTKVVTIVVAALQFDRLFSTSALGQRPVGGQPGTKNVFFPVNLVSSKTVYGVQFDLEYPRALVTLDSVVKTGRIPDYVVYDNVGLTPGRIRVVTFGLNNEPVGTSNTTDPNNPTAITFLALSINPGLPAWHDATMKLTGGRESVNPNPSVGSVPLVTDSGVVQVDSLGDVNLDQIIDVADAVNIVGGIIGANIFTPRQFAAADVVINASIDVFDLVGDINQIYGRPISPTPGVPLPNVNALMSLAYVDLPAGSRDVMKVTGELPEQIAGAQLEIRYDPGAVNLGIPVKTKDNGSFTLQYRDDGDGTMRIVLYHMAPFKANELMQIGTADLVSIPRLAKGDINAGDRRQIRLTQAFLSTANASAISVHGIDPALPQSFTLEQNYPNPFNPSTIIEFTLSSAEQVNLEIFNVLGQKVRSLIDESMTAGVHRLTWDATTNAGQRVATGIYLYRLKVGTESQTRKMLFLK